MVFQRDMGLTLKACKCSTDSQETRSWTREASILRGGTDDMQYSFDIVVLQRHVHPPLRTAKQSPSSSKHPRWTVETKFLSPQMVPCYTEAQQCNEEMEDSEHQNRKLTTTSQESPSLSYKRCLASATHEELVQVLKLAAYNWSQSSAHYTLHSFNLPHDLDLQIFFQTKGKDSTSGSIQQLQSPS